MPDRPTTIALTALAADTITLDYLPVPAYAEPAEIMAMDEAYRGGATVTLDIGGTLVAYRVKEREVTGPPPNEGDTPWYRFVLVRERCLKLPDR